MPSRTMKSFALPLRLAGGATLALLLILSPARTSVQAKAKADGPFTFETVVETAHDLAQGDYRDPAALPLSLTNMGYDQWRGVRFRPEKALWRGQGLPFELQFFHAGFLYQQPVTLHLVEGGKVLPLPLTRDMFDYGQEQELEQQMPEEAPAAGFRIHGPINTPDYFDEYLVFLGASYFRAVAAGQGYGLSARGLAVDTATPRGEEFPWFREFWIQKPRPGESELKIYALLDSQNLTGAYLFRVKPGEETTIRVTARIFLRGPLDKLGLAPLTSMFLYGENSLPAPYRDWRPEVHDSDGLQIRFANREWLWRPLQNPQTLLVSDFQADGLSGFGLMQRDTDFGNYQDLEARYENRPSLWIEPKGDWGPGHVELVQIPSDKEYHDNAAAYFVPDARPEGDKPIEIEYTMRWLDAARALPPGAHVTATRMSRVDDVTRFFVLDFAGGPLDKLPAGAQVTGVVSVGDGGRLLESQALRNEAGGGWRLVFKVALDTPTAIESMLPDRDQPVEVRAFLKHKDEALSETWSYAVKLWEGQ